MAHSAIMSVRITGNATDAQKAFEKTATKAAALGTVLGNLATAGIGKVWDTVKGFTQDVLTMSDSTEKFQNTMRFAGLDTTAIDKATKATRKYADTTVYGLDDIQNTAAQLAANGIKDYVGLTEAAGNLNAVAGGNADTFKSVAMVMTQTAGAGKLTTENWNQLSDAIPGASGKLQEALLKNGAYTGDFRDAMAKGMITAGEFNEAIMQLGMSDAAKEAAASTATMEGALGNLEAAIVGGLTDAFNIFKPMVTGAIGSAGDTIAEFSANATRDLQAFFTAFADSGAFETGRAMLAGIADTCKALGTAIWDVITAIMPIDGVFNGAADAGSKAGQVFNALTGVIRAAVGQFERVTDWIRQVAAGLRDTGAAQATRAAWDAIVQAGRSLWDMCANIIGSLAGVWQGMADGEGIAAALGTAWNTAAGIVRVAADALKGVSDWCGAHSDAVVSALAAIGGGFAAFKIAGVIQTAISAIQGFSAATKAAEIAQAAFNLVMNANPIMLVISAIGALVAGLTWFFTQTETGRAMWAAFTQFLTDAWNNVCAVFQTVCDAIGAAWDAACAWLSGAWQGFMDFISPLLDGLQALFAVVCTYIQTQWDIAGEGVRAAWETVKDFFTTIGDVIQNLWKLVTSVVQGDWEGAGNAVRNIWNAIGNFFSGLGSSIAGFFSSACSRIAGFFSGAGNAVRNIWNAIGGFFSGLGSSIAGFFSSACSRIAGFFSGAGNSVKAAWNGVVSWFAGLPGRIMGIFAGAGSWLAGAGSAIMDGLLGGLRAAWGHVTSFIGGIGDWIKSHKGPPSYDRIMLVENGKLIMSGFAKGLTSGFDSDVRKAIASVNVRLKTMPLSVTAAYEHGAKDTATPITVNVTFSGVVGDPEGVARQINNLLDDYTAKRR